MVLGGATISIKDHNDPEVLATHGHQKPELALSDVLPREVSLPFDTVQEPTAINHQACAGG